MSVDQIIIRHNVGHNVRLIKEEVEEGDGVLIPLGAVHGSNDGIAGEDSGAGAGEDRVAGDGRGGIEVEGTDEGLNAVVEAEAEADEGRGGVGEAGGIRVTGGRWGGGVPAEGVERRLDPEAALPAAALGGGLLSRTEGEAAVREEEGWGWGWGWSGGVTA